MSHFNQVNYKLQELLLIINNYISEVSKNIPQETESNLLTLTKASNLQGMSSNIYYCIEASSSQDLFMD